jgi:colanic acid biosynthesis protein WcaH
MLDSQSFRTAVENAPLVSIDLCLVCQGQILLGKRNNEPLKGYWFTPGGRIQKNERWQDALLRIAQAELGLCGIAAESFSLMGIWDHFYKNSAFDENISTHYVNLPHYLVVNSKPLIIKDDQHSDFEWFELVGVGVDKKFHSYTAAYALWLSNNLGETDD